MIDIINTVNELAEKECAEKTKERGPLVDFHHAYGVIREETDEMEDEIDKLLEFETIFWRRVKDDDRDEAVAMLKMMDIRARLAAAEAIQISAMCKKAINCLEGGEK